MITAGIMAFMRMSLRHFGLAFIGTWALACVCGTTQAQSLSEISMMSGPDRQTKLEAGAKKEGEVMLYTAQTVDDGVRPIEEGFSKKYPYIKYNYYRSASPGLIQRILSESRANKPAADVVIGSASAALKQAALLQPFTTPEFAVYPKEYQEPSNLWGTVRSTYNGIAFNTKLVSAADAPRTWEALLDPRWKGKMIWISDLGTGGPFLIHHLRTIWGEKKAADYFEGLRKQEIGASGATNAAILEFVAAGEYPILVSAALHQVARAKFEKSPVDFAAPDPVPSRPEQIMLTNTAPHPYAAMLLIDYVLSIDGQKILAQNGYLPANPKVEPIAYMREVLPRLTGKSEKLYMPEDTTANAEVLTNIYQKTSR